jgi:mono/diheme cytochrome c family protein
MSEESHNAAARTREQPEPKERSNPAPLLLGLIAVVLTGWGVSYFFLNTESTAAANAEPSLAANTAGQPATPAVDGGQIYTTRCVSCHQASGAGLPGVFPPLAGSEWVNGDPNTLALIPLLGINGSITVAGKSYSGAMPAFGAQLSDAELAAVLSHIRSSFGNHAPPVTPELVKTERDRYASRTQPWGGGDELKAQH